MALGTFRKLHVTVSIGFSLAALVLAVFATVGSVTNKSQAIDTIHFVRLDFSKLNLGPILSDTSLSSTFSNAAKAISFSGSDFGFANTYVLSNWGYCESDDSGSNIKYEYCSKPKALYHFDPQEFLQEQLNKNKYSTVVSQLSGSNNPLEITVPEDMEQYASTIKAVSQLIFICSFIGIGAFAVQLFIDHFAKKSHCLSFLSFLLALLGAAALLLAAAAATGMYSIVKSKVEDKLGDTGIKVILDPVYYGLIWGAFGAAVLSTIGWMFAICCGRTDVHEYVDDYKE